MSEPAVETVPPSLFRRMLDYLDWKINPVLLRDLRLYMRGKLMIAAYFLTLAVLVMLSVLYVIIARFDETDGTRLLGILGGLLAVICGAMIPNLVFERFRAELSNRATELALTSPLTPAKLVRGKLIGAWCMTLMVVSAAAPMLATSYLLGGINLLGLLGVVGGVVIAGTTVPMLQLSMAADFKGGKGLSRGLAALLFVIELVMMVYYSMLLYGTFVRTTYRTQEYAPILTCLVIGAILVGQFLYFNTVGILRGEAENRDVAPRLSLAAAAFLGAALAYGVFLYFDDTGSGSKTHAQFLGAILCFDSFAFCLGFTSACQSSPTTPRNLRDNWRTKPVRSLFFLPGIRSLTAYFLLMSTILMTALILVANHTTISQWWIYTCIALAPFMAISYGIVIYYYLMLPLVKDKRNPKLLSHTIGIVNIVLAIISVFAMVMVSYVWENEELFAGVLGVTPVGLVTIVVESSEHASRAGFVGFLTMGVLLLLMLGIVVGGEGGVASKRESETENAPE